MLERILFLTHVSDIDLELNFKDCSSIADDTRLLGKIPEYVTKLQDNLVRVYSSAVRNNILFYLSKFQHVRLSCSQDDPHG